MESDSPVPLLWLGTSSMVMVEAGSGIVEGPGKELGQMSLVRLNSQKPHAPCAQISSGRYCRAPEWHLKICILGRSEGGQCGKDQGIRTQKESGGFLGMNDKDLFKGLRSCNRETQRDDTLNVLKKNEKLRVLIIKSIFFRRTSSAFSASGFI